MGLRRRPGSGPKATLGRVLIPILLLVAGCSQPSPRDVHWVLGSGTVYPWRRILESHDVRCGHGTGRCPVSGGAPLGAAESVGLCNCRSSRPSSVGPASGRCLPYDQIIRAGECRRVGVRGDSFRGCPHPESFHSSVGRPPGGGSRRAGSDCSANSRPEHRPPDGGRFGSVLHSPRWQQRYG